MSPVLYPPSRPQSIGEVLDSAFRIFSATLLRCLPYGVLAIVAGQSPNIYSLVTRHPRRQFGGGDPIWWVLYIGGAFLGIALINAILIRQHAIATGHREAADRALRAGLRKAPAAAGLFIIMLGLIALCFAPLVVLPGGFVKWGLIGLTVPAAAVGVMLSSAWAVMLIGGRSIGESLRHSVRIVRGNLWRTIAIYSVGGVMIIVFYAVAGVIAAVLLQFAGTDDIAVITAVQAVLAAALGAAGVPFYTALALVLYGDLELRKEGSSSERQIADAAAG